MKVYSAKEKLAEKTSIGNNWVTAYLSEVNKNFPFSLKVDTTRVPARFKSAKDAIDYATSNIKELRNDIANAA